MSSLKENGVMMSRLVLTVYATWSLVSPLLDKRASNSQYRTQYLFSILVQIVFLCFIRVTSYIGTFSHGIVCIDTVDGCFNIRYYSKAWDQ